jgi:hypothetical protein
MEPGTSMLRPDNYGLLMALLFAGWIFGLACVIVSHRLARRLGRSNKPVALKVSVPTVLFLLNVVLLIAIPKSISDYYGSHYGYQLQPGEEPGPLGDPSEYLIMLLVFFNFLLVCGYALYLTGVFFKSLLSGKRT